jgi:hypothetical protein
VFQCLVEFPFLNYHWSGNRVVWGDINLVTLPYAKRT